MAQVRTRNAVLNAVYSRGVALELGDRKGVQRVQVGRHQLAFNWQHVPILIDSGLPLDDMMAWQKIDVAGATVRQQAGLKYFPDRPHTARLREPMYFRFTLYVPTADRDLHLVLDTWERGYVWVNDLLVSRYWSVAGPHRTVHVPAAYLRIGANSIVLLELSGTGDFTLRFAETPDLGQAAPLPSW